MNKIILALFALCLSLNVYSQNRDTITTSSGLKYIRIVPGNGVHPKDGQKLKVFYSGRFKDGKVFDSNMGQSAFKFALGKQEVIPGWDEGFKLMSKGEKGILIIPSKLAYGKRGVKDPENESKYMIPPDSDLIFEVELVDFK